MKTNLNSGSWNKKGSGGKVISPGELRKSCVSRGKLSKTASTSTESSFGGGSIRRITTADTSRMNDVPISDTIHQDHALVGTLNSNALDSPTTQEHTPIVEKDNIGCHKKRKPRGPNKCKKVARLKPGEKLHVLFNIRAVGENHEEFSRFLGKIVRSPNVCPLAVPRWVNIPQERIDHMWAIVQEKWHVDDEDKKVVIDWMRDSWRNARADFKRHYVKPCRNVEEAVKNIPPEVVKEEWEWLELSERNAMNRANVSMPCHTGSKPCRQVSYQIEKETGAAPDFETLYFETRKKDGKLVDLASIEKHNHIVEIQNAQPNLTPFEVVEKSMGPQRSDRVFGFGGGATPKHFNGSAVTKTTNNTQLKLVLEENAALKEGMATNSTRLKLVIEENTALKEGMATNTTQLKLVVEENAVLKEGMKHMGGELTEMKQMLRSLMRERASSPNPSTHSD